MIYRFTGLYNTFFFSTVNLKKKIKIKFDFIWEVHIMNLILNLLLMIKKLELWLENWLELFQNHYKIWLNMENSTVLVDWEYNIISFFDNMTDEIDVVMLYDIIHKWDFIIADNKKIKTNWKIKFERFYRDAFNRNYFTYLIKNNENIA